MRDADQLTRDTPRMLIEDLRLAYFTFAEKGDDMQAEMYAAGDCGDVSRQPDSCRKVMGFQLPVGGRERSYCPRVA